MLLRRLSAPLLLQRQTRWVSLWGGGEELLEASETPLLQSMNPNPKVFLDVEAGKGNPLGKIVIQLNSEVTPKAAENFVALCKGTYSTFGVSGAATRKRSLKVGNLHYKDTNFHRVLPGFLIQGGDNEHYDGTGGWCVFSGYKYFEDESYELPFDEAGVVGMAVEAPNRNASQFFITTAPAPHLQGKCVAIGKVVNGIDVVTMIEQQGTDHNDRPVEHIRITDCGVADA